MPRNTILPLTPLYKQNKGKCAVKYVNTFIINVFFIVTFLFCLYFNCVVSNFLDYVNHIHLLISDKGHTGGSMESLGGLVESPKVLAARATSQQYA